MHARSSVLWGPHASGYAHSLVFPVFPDNSFVDPMPQGMLAALVFPERLFGIEGALQMHFSLKLNLDKLLPDNRLAPRQIFIRTYHSIADAD